jgi:actin-related protein 5
MSNPNANLRICDARSTFVIQMQTFSDRAHAVVQQRLPPAHYSPHTPLVIDNGSFEFRAGWSSDQTPRIVHRNLVGVPRVKRHPNEDYVIVGDPILERESNRINTRSPFDRNVVYQSDLMEHVLDHAFAVCGVRGDTVQHPIVMTEALCNPNHCRGLMSELLFECYQVPSVCYGVDALFSYHYNVSTGHVPSPRQGPISAAVLVSSGWQATHIVPLIDGRAVMDHAFRLDVGGFHAHELMTKTMQLKYPHHKYTPKFNSLSFYWQYFQLCFFTE